MHLASGLRRHRILIGAAVLVAAVAFPLGAFASHQFTDVPDSSSYHDDIDALKDAGVTSGCSATKYCPKEFVTREQMAAFMNRLGALEAGKTPVVNATTVDGKSANELTRLAYDTSNDNALVGVDGIALTATITAPSAGFLSIAATTDSYGTAADDFFCYLAVDGTTITSSTREIVFTAGNTEDDCSTNGVWATLGGSSTVTLRGSSLAATTVFDEAVLTVQFVPFNGAGNPPILVLKQGKNGVTAND